MGSRNRNLLFLELELRTPDRRASTMTVPLGELSFLRLQMSPPLSPTSPGKSPKKSPAIAPTGARLPPAVRLK